MKERLLRRLSPFAGLLLFGVALWMLHGQLREHQLSEIVRELRALPRSRVAASLALTALNYALLTAYECLAFRSIRHPLPYRKISLASFIGYALSNNVGFATLSGGSIRYRLYSSWRLSANEIMTVITFVTLTFWLGFLALSGAVFLLEPVAVPQSLHLPFPSVRPLGALFVVLVVGYLIASARRHALLTIRGRPIRLPSIRMAVAQVALSALNFTLAGTALYVLLPSSVSVSYSGVLGMYLLAMVGGMVSQVPGGLGVFETVMLVLLAGEARAAALLGSLLAYRAIYYFLPLLVATMLFGVFEVWHRRGAVKRLRRVVTDG